MDSEPLFDAHLHPAGLSAQDLETMRLFGVARALIFPARIAEPTSKRILASFHDLLEHQLPRLGKLGIEARAALGLHPGCLPRRGTAEVIAALPALFTAAKGKVAALGEVGLHRGGEAEEEALLDQLELARRLKLPVVVHTPAAEKERHTRRLLTLLRRSRIPPERILVDHASGKTVRLILACGHHAGLTLHPDELSAERAVALVRRLGPERLVLDTDSGDRSGDILALARTVHRLRRAKLSPAVISRVCLSQASELFRFD